MEISSSKPYLRGFVPYALAAFLVGAVGGFTAVLGPAFVSDLNLPYPTVSSGVYGNSGDKMSKEYVECSGKG